jgi:hypothetical protein
MMYVWYSSTNGWWTYARNHEISASLVIFRGASVSVPPSGVLSTAPEPCCSLSCIPVGIELSESQTGFPNHVYIAVKVRVVRHDPARSSDRGWRSIRQRHDVEGVGSRGRARARKPRRAYSWRYAFHLTWLTALNFVPSVIPRTPLSCVPSRFYAVSLGMCHRRRIWHKARTSWSSQSFHSSSPLISSRNSTLSNTLPKSLNPIPSPKTRHSPS